MRYKSVQYTASEWLNRLKVISNPNYGYPSDFVSRLNIIALTITVHPKSLYVLLTYLSVPLKDQQKLEDAEEKRNKSSEQVHLRSNK